ncbi:MAG: hypothetical protein PHH83_05055 [Patescibacteria group bacterium]|nr:hypothetical protein [Patescibacteria group bacterium]
MIKKIDYYGDKDNYIHLKFGDARKMFNFTENFRKVYPLFTKEYEKYWNYDKKCQFKNPFQIVKYVFDNGIPVNFYYNFTDRPAKGEKEIMDYLVGENSFIGELEN